MFRQPLFALGTAAALIGGACTRTPVAPSPAAAAEVSAVGAAARPGGGPTASPHTLTIGPIPAVERQAAFPSPGHMLASGTVNGWIVGPTSTGFTASATSASFSATVVEVGGDQSAEEIIACPPAEVDYLRSIGLVGPTTSVTGALTLALEYKPSTISNTVLSWSLNNIGTFGGYQWDIEGGNGSNNPMTFPRVDPASTNQSLTVTVENGRAWFKGYLPGSNRKKGPDRFHKCKIDFKMTMVRQ